MFLIRLLRSLPIPTREEIENSPTANGPTVGKYAMDNQRGASPVQEDPSLELEKELAGTHLGVRR